MICGDINISDMLSRKKFYMCNFNGKCYSYINFDLLSFHTSIGAAKGRPKQAHACPNFMLCLPKCLVCPEIEIDIL